MNDSEEKAEKACRIVGKPYSPEQAEADVMLLPIIGDTIMEIEYDVNYCYINIIFTSGRRLSINAAGCYDFVVELETP
jgi:hypothetical protein